jgi:hypothetical protein
MAAGYKALTTKDQINKTIGGISVRLREIMDDIAQFDAFFQQEGAAGLVANFGFDQADPTGAPDANLVGTVNNEYAQLRQIYLGAQALASAKNFRTFAPQVEALF